MKALNHQNMASALKLYNQAIDEKELCYLPQDEAGFNALFLDRPVVFALMSDAEDGFILGHYDPALARYFLTMILVAPVSRRQGIGTELVNALQQEMEAYAIGHQTAPVQMEISYFNPVNIRWTVPGTKGHTHQNAQGVPLGSGAHLFFKNLGFRDFAYQNTYHMDLPLYRYPKERLRPYEERFSKAGFRVEFYDPEKVKGMDELLEDLDNEIWSRQIPEEMGREGGPRPFPIVNDHGRVGGFAGPIVVEPDGRCWLLGVAVHSRCRGVGAATLLFNFMCRAFQEAGALYLTLFTGESNPARNIYESAGMKIVYSWANMRRRTK